VSNIAKFGLISAFEALQLGTMLYNFRPSEAIGGRAGLTIVLVVPWEHPRQGSPISLLADPMADREGRAAAFYLRSENHCFTLLQNLLNFGAVTVKSYASFFLPLLLYVNCLRAL